VPAANYLRTPVTKKGDGSRKIDFTVGGPDSRDGLDSKSSKSKRPALLVNAGKITAPQPGRLWFVYSNYDGAWIWSTIAASLSASTQSPAKRQVGQKRSSRCQLPTWCP